MSNVATRGHASRPRAVNDHAPRKRFGQNFLADPHYLARIADAVAPRPGDIVVEIGPGLGALTAELIARAGRVIAIEIDRDLAARLAERFPPPALELVVGDALAFDFRTLGRNLRVVGNLPYNISSPLLFHLADQAGALHDLTVMLQKEVVARMTAEPATEHASFDLALLDMLMPVMDGLTLAERIRADARWHALPIVILTSLGRRDQDARADLGIAAVLTKPGKTAQLRDTLLGILLGRRRHGRNPDALAHRQHARRAPPIFLISQPIDRVGFGHGGREIRMRRR